MIIMNEWKLINPMHILYPYTPLTGLLGIILPRIGQGDTNSEIKTQIV